VFWHRARADVAAPEYERRLRAFHERLDETSASFRVTTLPFAAEAGYEDWYLVDDWAALGTLSAMAVSGTRQAPHDSAARLAGDGWGGVYALVRGAPILPVHASWVSKPDGQDYGAFLDSLSAATVWQRQLVLGPAPEFCLAENGDATVQQGEPGRVVVHLDSSRSHRQRSSA
jgi:hypothetical protein